MPTPITPPASDGCASRMPTSPPRRLSRPRSVRNPVDRQWSSALSAGHSNTWWGLGSATNVESPFPTPRSFRLSWPMDHRPEGPCLRRSSRYGAVLARFDRTTGPRTPRPRLPAPARQERVRGRHGADLSGLDPHGVPEVGSGQRPLPLRYRCHDVPHLATARRFRDNAR